MPKKHPPELREEALRLLKDGLQNSEVSYVLGISRRTISTWRKEAGLPASRGEKREYTIEQINTVIDMIREGFTIGEITAHTGVNNVKIKEIHHSETEDGNPLPELRKGVARSRKKFSDEDLIDLALLNRGYGFNEFVDFLGVSKGPTFDLFYEFKQFTGEDPYNVLQDTSNHTLVSAKEYLSVTGKKYLPVGYGHTNGNKVKGENRNTHKKVPLPPQTFNWGEIKN